MEIRTIKSTATTIIETTFAVDLKKLFSIAIASIAHTLKRHFFFLFFMLRYDFLVAHRKKAAMKVGSKKKEKNVSETVTTVV